MLKSIIILPDGTEISSGVGQTNNIRSTALTECVNSGEELTLGSVCSNMLEATLQTPSGNLSLTAGAEITLCKEAADGRHQVGVFTLEKPTKPSANLLKLVGYDRVAKLDKDLTSWLKGLDGWPYSLLTFAGMVCRACGLTLVTKSIPNGDYQVPQLEIEATGRQLMGWIGEVCCRFCRATPSGDIELAWYQQSNISFAPSGEHFYFQRGLSFEDYQVAPVEAVQLRLADSDDGALWPAAADGANSYIIKNNPILLAAVTDTTRAALKVIEGVLQGVTYTPCKVSIPATLDIHAGDIVQITDVNGVTITTHVMTKVQKGQKDTMECTGSPRRDSSTVVNNEGPAYVSAAQAGAIASSKAAEETGKLDQLELLKRLTKEWADDGIYLTGDGKLGINASAILTGILSADLIDTEHLKVKAANVTGTLVASQIDASDLKVAAANITGTLVASQIDATDIKVSAANITGTLVASQIDATDLKVSAANIDGTITAGKVDADEGYIGGWTIDTNGLFRGTSGTDDFLGLYSQHPDTAATIGGVSSANWRIVAGTSFGVTRDGHLAASNATISGKITAESGKIGPWSVEHVTVYSGTAVVYSGVALTAYANGTQVALTPEYLYVTAQDSYGNYTEYAAKWTKLAAMAQ